MSTEKTSRTVTATLQGVCSVISSFFLPTEAVNLRSGIRKSQPPVDVEISTKRKHGKLLRKAKLKGEARRKSGR